jgi:5-methylcytosine-specific restriction endonuclease McrA
MHLPPIPTDPEPTDAEIDAVEKALDKRGRPDVIRRLARLGWRYERRLAAPDDFLVPFADWVVGYKDYLASPQWQSIRQYVLREADHRCVGCGGSATQVHHRDYRPRVLRGEDLIALVAMCKTCHERIHEGKDTPWEEQEQRLYAMVARRGRPRHVL